ncbi:MAG: DUF87 domain-containing protein, partial [Candidatus Omnitrophica bacterium]|nr:DUF87 domain-containing protein [Candidatus Omnitrophota bacterium]
MRDDLSLEQILELMERLGGFDDPQLAALAYSDFVWSSKDPFLRNWLVERLEALAAGEVIDPTLFELPSDEADGPILLGNALEDEIGAPVGLDLLDLNTMVLVLGTHRSGKTTLLLSIIRQVFNQFPGVNVFLFDSKNDFGALYREYDDLLVVPWQEFTFNPLQVPPGVNPVFWINRFIDIFCSSYTIRDFGWSILGPALNSLYSTLGVFKGEDNFPTLRQLMILLSEKKRSSSRETEALGSLVNRLKWIVQNWKVDYSKGFCV